MRISYMLYWLDRKSNLQFPSLMNILLVQMLEVPPPLMQILEHPPQIQMVEYPPLGQMFAVPRQVQ